MWAFITVPLKIWWEEITGVALDRRDHNESLMIRPSQLVTNISTTMRVMWLGVVDSVKWRWDHYNWSAFANVSLAQSWYKGIDFFRPKIIDIDGVTYEVNSENRERCAGNF